MKAYFSDFTQKTYTAQEFTKMLERRIRKDWRTHKLLQTSKKYALIETPTISTALLKKFLEKIFVGRFSLTLFLPKENIPERFELLSDDCLDTYLSSRLNVFLQKKPFEVFQMKTPLRSITKKECEQLAKLWHITGKDIPDGHEIIHHLHEKYNQTKQSMLKSFLHIEETVNFSK